MEDTSLEDFVDDGDDSGEAESERSETASDPGAAASDGESERSEAESDVESKADDESSGAESKSPVGDSPAGVESAADTPAVEPADVTARWTANGACCDACGNEVERLWTDGETAVCSECKNWE